MANQAFQFGDFINFSGKELNFDELMRQFQTTQAHHEDAAKARDEAKLEFQQWQEYLELTTDYRDLFSSMMKKLLDAKTGTEIEKIRTVYGNKLVPVLQKINVIQKKIVGLPTPAQLESRAVVSDKFAQVRALIDQATKLKDEVMSPSVPEPVITG